MLANAAGIAMSRQFSEAELIPTLKSKRPTKSYNPMWIKSVASRGAARSWVESHSYWFLIGGKYVGTDSPELAEMLQATFSQELRESRKNPNKG